MQVQARDGRAEATAKWLVFALLSALTFAIAYALMARPASDLSIHATWASEGDFLHPRSFVTHHAHPLWHFTAKALMLTGLGFRLSGALAMLLWKLPELGAAYALARRLLGDDAKPYAPALCTLCLMLVSAVCVPALNPTVYVGGGTPNTWHSPTQQAVLGFMLLCVPMVASSYDRFAAQPGYREPWKSWLLLTALLALSVLAKPVYLQAFLPAACLFFLVQWIRHPSGSRYFLGMVAAVVPSVLMMALQTYFYFLNPSGNTGMAILLTWDKAKDCLIGLALLEAFPLFALLTEKRGAKGTLLTLTVLYNAVAFLEKLLLSEVGQRANDGNFGWGLLAASLMLWAVMLPRFVRQFREWRAAATRTGTWRYWLGGSLLAYHLASGVYYAAYLLTTTNAL